MVCKICEKSDDLPPDHKFRFVTVPDLKRHYKKEHGLSKCSIKHHELTSFELKLFRQRYIQKLDDGTMIFKVFDTTNTKNDGETNTPAIPIALKIKLKLVKLINGVWTAINDS